MIFNGQISSAPRLSARNNTIEHLSASVQNAQILAIGIDTSGVAVASGPNRIEQFDGGNAAPDVVIGSGATLYWGSNATPPGRPEAW